MRPRNVAFALGEVDSLMDTQPMMSPDFLRVAEVLNGAQRGLGDPDAEVAAMVEEAAIGGDDALHMILTRLVRHAHSD